MESDSDSDGGVWRPASPPASPPHLPAEAHHQRMGYSMGTNGTSLASHHQNSNLADIFGELSDSKRQVQALMERYPPPTYDVDLLSSAPWHRNGATVGGDRGEHKAAAQPEPSKTRAGNVNLYMDGSKPFLCGKYSRGTTGQTGNLLGPTPGFLPSQDLSSWDKERAALPDRARPINGRLDWKPGRFARKATFNDGPAGYEVHRVLGRSSAARSLPTLQRPTNTMQHVGRTLVAR